MSILNSTYNAIRPNCDADLVILDGDDVYNCYLLPGIDNADNTAVESLACWRIEKICMTEDDGVTTYKRLYPNGSTAFTFTATQYSTYSYAYKK